MEIFKTQEWDWPSFILDWLMQLVMVAGFVALSVWLWPEDVIDTPVSLIKLGD